MDAKLTDSAGTVTNHENITEVVTKETPPPPPPGPIKLLKITDEPYNAGEDRTPAENFNAIKKCYADAKTQRAQVEIPSGMSFRVGGTLTHDSITVFNNGELLFDNMECGYYFKGSNSKLIGGTLSHEGLTIRGSQMWHHGIGIFDCDVFEILDVHIVNPSAAGICCWDGRNGKIRNVTIDNCLADGIHTVASNDGASGNNFYKDCTVRGAGDDSLSFVTYGGYSDPNSVVHNVEVWNFRGSDSIWGRGITLLGCTNIVVNGAILSNIFCFGLYSGVESGYGQRTDGILNDIKLDICGHTASADNPNDVPDGILMNGGTMQVNDSLISRPKRYGLQRYWGNVITNNVIYNECPWGDTHGQSGTYSFPRRGRKFDPPPRLLRRQEDKKAEAGAAEVGDNR